MKATRKPILAANWKMNKSLPEVKAYLETISGELAPDLFETILFPPSIFIPSMNQDENQFLVGCQNVHYQEKGAFTGELAVDMLKPFNVSYVLIGHSERRSLFGERDGEINLKVKTVLKHKLCPMICVGEDLKTRESGKVTQVISKQVEIALLDVDPSDVVKVVIAYEPVWAIGTGKTPTVEDAQLTIKDIRNTIKRLYNEKISEQVRILYGGSVNVGNIKGFVEPEEIDGVLIGGAALDPKALLLMSKTLH